VTGVENIDSKKQDFLIVFAIYVLIISTEGCQLFYQQLLYHHHLVLLLASCYKVSVQFVWNKHYYHCLHFYKHNGINFFYKKLLN
jgi:hypothetical protein